MTLENVTIDFCPRCRGSWFDLHEFQQIYDQRHSVSDLLLPALPHLKRDAVACAKCGDYGSRNSGTCVRCKAPLNFLCPGCSRPLAATDRHGLTIDCCHACKGVWLDGGELTQLFEHYSRTVQDRSTISDTAVASAGMALDMFIWAPDLYIAATAQVLTHLPELASKGLDLAGDVPQIAGKAAEGMIGAAGAASDLAADALSGAVQVAGSVGSMASDAAASFLEMIVDLLAGIFD
jgi:Zn-finger nucleic acid-binding protein